jgi:hypothetical protein
MGHDLSDGEGVGAFAAGVLEDLYAAVYGERPVGVRSWCDRDSLLMLLLRLAGPAPFGGVPREHGGTLPYEAIPELVATAVRVQTGCELAVGSWSVEADLGLVMFVFRLPAEPLAGSPAEQPRVVAATATPKAEPVRERASRRTTARVPSWRAWSPLPPGGVAGEHEAPAERRRLRLVDDERESGSILR